MAKTKPNAKASLSGDKVITRICATRVLKNAKVIRKELRAVEKAIALLDERKRTLSANYLGESDSEESLRLHDELAAATGELNEAEEKWVRLQEELDAAD